MYIFQAATTWYLSILAGSSNIFNSLSFTISKSFVLDNKLSRRSSALLFYLWLVKSLATIFINLCFFFFNQRLLIALNAFWLNILFLKSQTVASTSRFYFAFKTFSRSFRKNNLRSRSLLLDFSYLKIMSDLFSFHLALISRVKVLRKRAFNRYMR